MSTHQEVSQISSAGDGPWNHLEDIRGDLILEGCVLVSGKEKQLKLLQNGIILADQDKRLNSKNNTVRSWSWRDVICAASNLKSSSCPTRSSFTLHYIKHNANSKLRVETLTMTDPGGRADRWITAVNEGCQNVPGRPMKAFVIVNPIGGAGRGKHIYTKTVAPLFDLAGMHVTVTITEKSKHAIELGEHQDFSGYDVIVTVGGDGLYQEVLLGLTLQTQRKAGVDYNAPDCVLSKPDIAFGIIPAGTGNGLTVVYNGTVDVVTAALNIIRGEKLKTQILTVHSDGKFITLSAFCFAYGELAYAMKQTDDRRWMGRLRYPYTWFGFALKKPRMFNCSLEYRVADKQEEHNADNRAAILSNQEAEWILYTDNRGPVSGFLSTTYEYIVKEKDAIINPQGKCIDLLINFGSTRLNLIKAMFSFFTGKNAARAMPPKLDRITRITGFRIKVTPDPEENESATRAREREIEMEKVLDIDGEIAYVDKPDMDIRLHSDFVTIYGCVKSPDTAKAE